MWGTSYPQPDTPHERTVATYYTSALYPEPMTPEYINGAKPNRLCKRGQTPWPMNKWTPYDMWYMTNNWIHKYGDKYTFGAFGFTLHSVTVDDQGAADQWYYSKRTYPDDILAQTAGGIAVGLQLGFIFGCGHTFNAAKEANIFQSISMPPNRWLPIHKANFRFRRRIFATCMLQASSFIGTYCLVDACISQMRNKDDYLNPILAGFASGGVLFAWFKNPFMTVSLGFFFGCYMSYFRFCVLPEDTPKLALDFNRPLWGVVGGLPMWIAGEEPDPDRVQYSWLKAIYRK